MLSAGAEARLQHGAVLESDQNLRPKDQNARFVEGVPDLDLHMDPRRNAVPPTVMAVQLLHEGPVPEKPAHARARHRQDRDSWARQDPFRGLSAGKRGYPRPATRKRQK